jgi:hypothetical protein
MCKFGDYSPRASPQPEKGKIGGLFVSVIVSAALAALADGSEKLPGAPTESFSRGSFYQERLDGEAPYLVDGNVLPRRVKPENRDYPA